MQQLTPASLFQTLTSLLEASHQLSTRMAQAAENLHKKGEIPEEHLLEELTTFQRKFLDLRAQGVVMAETLALPSQPAIETLTSLHSLKKLLEEMEKAEQHQAQYEETLHHAFRTLDRVLLLRHQDQENFSPLLECQERAREMRKALEASTWTNMHPALEALANGEDPFSDLLTWIEQQNTLEDDHWALLEDTVEQFFGKQIAIAISRGKLLCPDSSEKETVISPDLPIIPSSEVAPEATENIDAENEPIENLNVEGFTVDMEEPERLPQETSTPNEIPQEVNEGFDKFLQVTSEHLYKPESEELFSVNEMPEDHFTSLPEKKEEEEPRLETNDDPQLTEPAPFAAPYSFGLDDSAQHIAETMSQNQKGPHHPEALRDLTWRLIFEDKLTLAFHLASYLEVKHPHLSLRPPGWMIRSIVLGRHLRHAKGETARFLAEDLRHFSQKLYIPDQNEWNQTVTFLMTAATLQPALLAPHTQAPAILQSLRWEEGLSQLSTYCESIADYGANQSLFNPNYLKKGKEQTSWQSEIDTLKQAVELWWSRAPRIAFSYAPAAKVWQKWLEQKGVIATLLSPIRQNDTSKVTAVQQLIETFSNNVRLTNEVKYTDQEILGRHLGGDISGRALEQIRLHTREALGFARRWIELQEIHSGQRSNTSLEKMEQLRQTVWTLQGAVQEELSLFKRRHPSLLIMSSLICCRRAIDHLQILFDPEAAFPTEEPLPRPLLYADLLRIPTVSLNDQWEVEGSDWEALVEGVLELLANIPGSAKKAAA